MGNTFEVWSWEKRLDGGGYEYVEFYKGEEFDKAMIIMKDLKDKGAKCVKFMWR